MDARTDVERARRWRSSLAICVAVPALIGLAVVVPGGPADAGAVSSSSGFVPVTPRRLVDTRIGLGSTPGHVAPGSVLQLPAPADTPADAVGLALTVTTDLGAQPGYITAYPCGSSRPLASLLNPRSDEARSNQLLVRLDATREVCLYSKDATDVIVDLTGWLTQTGALFHQQQPARVLDTRFGPRPDGGSGKPAPDSVVQIPLAGTGGIPAGAVGVAANITVTDTEGDGFVTAFPCGDSLPPSSTGNYPNGGTRASFGFIGLGSGALCVYTLRAANLVVDITGWFGPGAGGQPVLPATPRRLLDTRFDPGGLLLPGEARVVRLGMPAGASTAMLNVTATGGWLPGWIQVGPCASWSGTSTVNFNTGMDIANLASVLITGTDDDSVCVRANVPTHVIVDVAASNELGPVGQMELTSHNLVPAFRPDILDYVVRCTDGSNALSFDLAAEPGSTVSVNGGSAVDHESVTDHLTPGQGTSITFAGAASVTYRVRCLPASFPPFTARRIGNNKAGWYVLTANANGEPNGYAFVVDHEGVPVWWYKDFLPVSDAKIEPGPTIAWSGTFGSFGADPNNAFVFRSLDAAVVSQAKAVGSPTDFHDMQVLPNGNRLVLSYPERTNVDLSALGLGTANVLDGLVQELTPAGAVVWQWRTNDHFDASQTTRIANSSMPNGDPVVDIVHVNAIEPEPGGSGYIVSARNTDSLYRIDKATGDITWKLGGKPLAGVNNLGFVNDPLNGPIAQHDPRFQPDGTLSMYDNRSGAGAPRMVRYALNIGGGTATMVQQITDPAITSSPFTGSARRTAADTWVVDWGGTSTITETDAAGNRLFVLTLADGRISYRGIPVDPGGLLSRPALEAGMDAQHPH